MLGTFSFEPYFKSYCCFIVGSLGISEIANRSFLPPPAPSSVFPRRRCAEPSPAQWRASPPTFYFALVPTRRAAPSPPPFAIALCPSLLWHAPPPSAEPPRGRYLNAAVERPLQHPRASSLARTSTTSIPASYSSPPFAFSLLPRHRTHRRSTQNAGELDAAVDLPHYSFSARTNPSIIFASSTRS